LDVELENRKRLPLPWFEWRLAVADVVKVEGEALGATASAGWSWIVRRGAIGWRERQAWRFTLRPTVRGYHTVGPATIRSADLLGMFPRTMEDPTADHLLVFPRVYSMQELGLPADRPFGDRKGQNRLYEDPLRVAGLRDYRPGDPMRRIDWKATARRSAYAPRLMVNTYQDEREQPVVVALDMGRSMQSPFDGLTLLDHAVNAALVVLNTALRTHDRAGLVAFDREVRAVVPPDRKRGQLGALLEALYRLDPGYEDPSFEGLFATLRGRLSQRSLVLLISNFDTVAGLERQLPYLRGLARRHRLVVVLFENTGIRELLGGAAGRLEDVYVKATAEGLAHEKREVVRTLERHGIGALLTSPERLTTDAVNRYLQIKAQGVL